MADRVFTDEELRALGARTLDLLEAAIDAGDAAGAKALARRMYGEFGGMHDLYRDWITDLLTYIGRRDGDAALADALATTVGRFTTRLGRRYAGKPFRRRVEMLAAGLRGHLQPMTLEEDAEKVTIVMPLCGSGGRLVREGAYDRPDGFLRVHRAQAMTFGREDFPVYCAHCHFQNVSPAVPGGPPLFVTEPAARLGAEPCRCVVPKEDGAR